MARLVEELTDAIHALGHLLTVNLVDRVIDLFEIPGIRNNLIPADDILAERYVKKDPSDKHEQDRLRRGGNSWPASRLRIARRGMVANSPTLKIIIINDNGDYSTDSIEDRGSHVNKQKEEGRLGNEWTRGK